MRRSIDHWRLYVFLGAFVALLGIIGYRVFVIAYVKHAWYSSAVDSHAQGSVNVLARGAIYLTDRDGTPHVLATNKHFPLLTVRAADIPHDRTGEAIAVIASRGDVPYERAAELVSKRSDLSIPIGDYLEERDVSFIESREIPGVSVTQQADRFYPDGALAADVTGFFGYGPDGRQGQYGIEAFYESELAGTRRTGAGAPSRSLWQYVLAFIGRGSDGTQDDSAPLPSDVTLTIDRNVQVFVQEALSDVLERFGAQAGSITVQEVTTGRIVAMADSPSFDPNRYGSADAHAFLNGPTHRSFEPGSSFKPFTMAIGIDTGSVTPDTTYTDYGFVDAAGYTIKNFTDTPFGTVTMTRVLEKSINTGTMFVEQRVGNDPYLEYLVNFGFGQRTGVDLPGEATGDIGNLYRGRDINFLTASFGQGITVTPLQMAMGYSALANGGKLMKPYVVDRIVRGDEVLYEAMPEVVGIPIKQSTAASLRAMLTSVVDNGFDKARIPRYDVAGKTGTAQIADPEGGYLEDEYIHSFAGFIPSTSDAQYTIVIIIERPHGVTFASDSLSPVFKEIALFLINYFRIPPTR